MPMEHGVGAEIGGMDVGTGLSAIMSNGMSMGPGAIDMGMGMEMAPPSHYPLHRRPSQPVQSRPDMLGAGLGEDMFRHGGPDVLAMDGDGGMVFDNVEQYVTAAELQGLRFDGGVSPFGNGSVNGFS